MPENLTTCFRCKVVFSYDGEKYRDVNCTNPICGVQNSVYKPIEKGVRNETTSKQEDRF